MTDREEIIRKNPLLEYCEKRGWEPKKATRGFTCLCPLHKETTPSFGIDEVKNVFHCFGCGEGGSVIDLHSKLHGLTIGQAMRELSGECQNSPEITHSTTIPLKSDKNVTTANSVEKNATPKVPETFVCAYDYHNAAGQLVYQVCRYKPKTFKQRRVMPDGSLVWKMEGVERVLYNLPQVIADKSVMICEGEKDCDTLAALGITATTNAGGAEKWLPSYSYALKGKKVYIVPDNDEAGARHCKKVLDELAGIVDVARIVSLPKEWNGKPIKDVSDFRASFDETKVFISEFHRLCKEARLIDKAVDLDLYSMREMEQHYQQEIRGAAEVTLDLRKWLPSLGIRPLGPGDLMGLIAGTGQLKSASVQNILACNYEIASLYFQMEITTSLMFERGAAIATGIDADKVYATYLAGNSVAWQKSPKFSKMLVCPRSGLTIKDIDEMIARSSAKFGEVPKIFVVDYIQLIRGKGTRYERVSDAAEEAKILAKKWNMVGILVSQIGRKKDEKSQATGPQEPCLTDAKESGSFENSCGLVLGVWKTEKEKMKLRVLKNTKGTAGQTVNMDIRGGTFIIEPGNNQFPA